MLIVKRPAHSSLEPGRIKWRQLTKEEIRVLQKYFCDDTVKSLQKKVDTQSNNLVGYYRSTGTDRIFVKILPDENSEVQNNAEQVTAWLYQAGIGVNCVKKGFPKKILEDDLWLYAYNYIDYELSNRSKEQLYSIGKEMGRIHRLLKNYPDRKNVRIRGSKKNQILFEQLNNVRQDKVVMRFSESAIELIKKTSDAEYQCLTRYAQMIHGDMNIGNVLINKLDDNPVIIDFEDATASWLSPLYDIAFVIQRFIMLQENNEKYDLALAFIKGYKTENNISNIGASNDLKILMKLISIRSLLILSMLPEDKQVLYLDEVEKFVGLYKKAQDNSSFISDIGALINKQ